MFHLKFRMQLFLKLLLLLKNVSNKIAYFRRKGNLRKSGTFLGTLEDQSGVNTSVLKWFTHLLK